MKEFYVAVYMEHGKLMEVAFDNYDDARALAWKYAGSVELNELVVADFTNKNNKH